MRKKCKNCTVTFAEILLINGKEKDRLCNSCCSEALYSMVLANNTMTINNKDKNKAGLTVLEIK